MASVSLSAHGHEESGWRSDSHRMGSMRIVVRSEGSSMCSVVTVTSMVPPSSTAATSAIRGPIFARPYLQTYACLSAGSARELLPGL